MDGINIDDLTIEQYLRLTQENQTPSMVKKVDDMTIVEYIENEERMKRQYSRKHGSYFPTYFGHFTSNNNTTIEFIHSAYFNPIQPNTDFSYDSNDMELNEEASFEEDLDEWLKVEMEKHMSKQNEKNEEDALIAIIKSIREECRAVHKNKQISASKGADLKKSSETMEDIINNDSFANASNNVMPRSIYEYLKLANLGRANMSGNDYLRKTFPRNHSFPDRCIPLFYDDESGVDYGMWPTCDPDSSFCYGYKEVFEKNFLQVRYRNQRIDDTTREQRYYEWVAKNYKFDNNRTSSTTTVSEKYPYKTNYPTPIPLDEWDTRCHITYPRGTSNQNIPNNDPKPFSLEHSELGEKANISEPPELWPFRPRPCDYSFDDWLKVKIGHTNIYESDWEIIFDEYKRVFDNEVENLSNEYTLRVGKKGYVLDNVWEKCEQYHKKVIDSWHDVGYEEEEELWQSGYEKTDYEPPFVDVKTFEVKKYSFKRGQSFICITKQDDDALPLGRVNGERFKAMFRKEMKDKGIAHDET
ncbi:hypothetical protein Tco_1531888 [Tanacetum coccineum]